MAMLLQVVRGMLQIVARRLRRWNLWVSTERLPDKEGRELMREGSDMKI